MNYYEILGLRRDATQDQIKKAYRTMAMLYHPDKNPSEQAQQEFLLIKTAYECLIDIEKKVVYDDYLDGKLFSQPVFSSPEQPSPSYPFEKKYKSPPDQKDRLRAVLIFVALLIFFSAAVISSGYFINYYISHNIYLEGVEAEKNNDLELAEGKYAQALDYYYRDSDCLFRLAKIEFYLGKFSSALSHITECQQAQKNPTLESQFFFCEVLLRTKNFDKAQRVLETLPESEKKQFFQAIFLLYGKSDFKAATVIFDKLIEGKEFVFESWVEKANYLHLLSLPLESNEAALQALKIRPQAAIVYFIFGKNAILLSNIDQACQNFILSAYYGKKDAAIYINLYKCKEPNTVTD